MLIRWKILFVLRLCFILRRFFLKRFISILGSHGSILKRFLRIVSFFGPRAFFLGIFFSRLYWKAGDTKSAEYAIRIFQQYDDCKIDVVRALLKIKSYYKVLNVCSGFNNKDLNEKFGHVLVELLGDAYFGLRRYKEALDCYEFVIGENRRNKSARIKSAEIFVISNNPNIFMDRYNELIDMGVNNSKLTALYERVQALSRKNKNLGEVRGYYKSKYSIDVRYKFVEV